MVVFDASFVLLLIEPDAPPPQDPTTGKPVDKCKERIEHLVVQLGQQRVPILVPAPALAEFLVGAGKAATAYLDELQSTAAIKVEPFGQRAAIECALLLDGAKKVRRTETRAKVKFDRQILATAKAVGAKTLYTTDVDLAALATKNGVQAFGVHELDLPPVDPQMDLLPRPTEE
jgi:predicted nucleic acid-binding protein